MVVLRSSQMPPVPVKMLYWGYADPLRVKQTPLPQKGSQGLIIFPDGDIRSAFWLGSYYPDLRDAITSDPNDPTIDYDAHWSGYWRYLDKNGTLAQQWPDGSYLVIGSGTTLPTLFRHIVDEQQQQQRVQFTLSDRVSGMVDPFSLLWQQAGSGMTMALDGSGRFSITGGPDGSFSLAYASGTTFTLDASGGVTIRGKAGATVAVDTQGNIALNIPSGAEINLTQGGAAGDGVPLLSALIAAFNSHTHGGVQTGTGTSATPTTPLTTTQIASKVLKLQQ